jgi:Thioesterase domain
MLQTRLSIPEILISVIMKRPTMNFLCKAIKILYKVKEYDPVVVLQGKDSIIALSPRYWRIPYFYRPLKYLQWRPVYALRARGFEEGYTCLENIEEAVNVYHAAIKTKQPNGPYALARYLYSTMLAFETSKVLQANRD